MKYQLSKIALALPLSIATLSVAALTNAPGKANDDGFNGVLSPAQQNFVAKKQNAALRDRYFVLLEDAPLAMYDGRVKGYQATSVQSTRGGNVDHKGKLDINTAASQKYLGYLQQAQFNAQMQMNISLHRDVAPLHRFQNVLNAMVVELDKFEVAKVRKLPGVLAVEKEERHQLQTDRGPEFVGGTTIWEGTENYTGTMGEGVVVGIMDTGIASYTQYQWSGDYSNTPFHPSFASVGADGYQHVNPLGEGVYLGDCADEPHWCSDKLIGVVSYDEITSLYQSWETRYMNGQDSHGHGSHTASTVAGNIVHNVPITNAVGEMAEMTFDQISGVAPHANIISYQTCHPTAGCWPSLAVESIEHAMENGVDVMNYSVGGGASSPWFRADSLAMLAAREAGIHIAVSAGNDGSGPETVKSPANSPWVTSVAAYTHDRAFEEKTASFGGGDSDMPQVNGLGATSGVEALELVYAGDVQDDYSRDTYGDGVCGGVNWSTLGDVSGKVLVCKRGGVDWEGEPLARVHKSKIAKQWGAAGMILINTDETSDSLNADFHSLPTIHINNADGQALLGWMATGTGHTVSFNESAMQADTDGADIAADFTSRGPELYSPDYLVPAIAAPGVDIYAANIGSYNHYSGLEEWAKVNGDFRFMSGTSMAGPHVAGAMALMKAARPDWTPAEVQSAIMMTSHTETYTDDDYDGEKTPSTPFDDGAGSMRVNRAAEAGLVMHETEQGYLAANPFAEEYGIAGDIEDWHGEPSRMNIPSLAKKDCFLTCSWTRTFKATKTGNWTVTSELASEGFAIEVSPASFSLSEGEEIEVKFTATPNQALADEWVFGDVWLKADDAGIPDSHLPVAVNFIAGSAPEYVDIHAMRNNDSVAVEDIFTIGTDNLQVTKTQLALADVHEVTIMRDTDNSTIFEINGENESAYVFQFNVQARSKRLVVDVLETSSPDVDLYMGFDDDLDGVPGWYDGNVAYMSAGSDSDESIDIMNPAQGTYWVLVHNFEGTTEDNPIEDTLKLSAAVVKYDDETMTVDAPTSVGEGEDVPLRIQWDNDMAEGELYYGAVSLGTTPDLADNVGVMRVALNRGEDDVSVNTAEVNDESGVIEFDIAIATNRTPEARDYSFAVELASGVEVMSLSTQTNEAVPASTSADDVDYSIDGNVLSWNHQQAMGANAVSFALSLDTSDVVGMADVTPVLSAGVNTSPVVETTAPAEPVFVEGRPTFTASASETSVKEGEPVNLSANVIDAVIADPTLSYEWVQVSGPTVALTGSGALRNFVAPDVSEDTSVSFQMVGSNGSKTSEPVTVSVGVENKGSSGSTGTVLLSLMSIVALLRRRQIKQ